MKCRFHARRGNTETAILVFNAGRAAVQYARFTGYPTRHACRCLPKIGHFAESGLKQVPAYAIRSNSGHRGRGA